MRFTRSPLGITLRSFFGAIEDWNFSMPMAAIATKNIAIVLRGDRGLEQEYEYSSLPCLEIAIVLRGDRGLEQSS